MCAVYFDSCFFFVIIQIIDQPNFYNQPDPFKNKPITQRNSLRARQTSNRPSNFNDRAAKFGTQVKPNRPAPGIPNKSTKNLGKQIVPNDALKNNKLWMTTHQSTAQGGQNHKFIISQKASNISRSYANKPLPGIPKTNIKSPSYKSHQIGGTKKW